VAAVVSVTEVVAGVAEAVSVREVVVVASVVAEAATEVCHSLY
jgi:hypothetical protein